MEFLYWILIGIVLGLAVWLSFKADLKSKQLYVILDIMTLMKMVNSNIDYPYQDELERVLEYTVGLVNFLEPYVDEKDFDHDEMIATIIKECDTWCMKEEIAVNEELTAIIKLLARYITEDWFLIKES